MSAPEVNRLANVADQVRWLRHAIERLIFVNGLACGVAIIYFITSLIGRML